MSAEQFREPNRLPSSNYFGFGAYLVTICAQNRERIFTAPDVVEPLICLLSEEMRQCSFDVHAYCFMPDHCHLLLSGLNSNAHLSTAVRAFKGASTALLRQFRFQHVWQKGFHDHVIRNAEDLAASMAYVLENPVRAGLVKDPKDWPFSGSLVFEWRAWGSVSK